MFFIFVFLLLSQKTTNNNKWQHRLSLRKFSSFTFSELDFLLKWQGLSSWLSAFIFPFHFKSAFCTSSQYSPFGNKTHPHVKRESLPLLVFVSDMMYLFRRQGPVVKDGVRSELREQRKDCSDSLVTHARGAGGERSPDGPVGSAWIIRIIVSTFYFDSGDSG